MTENSAVTNYLISAHKDIESKYVQKAGSSINNFSGTDDSVVSELKTRISNLEKSVQLLLSQPSNIHIYNNNSPSATSKSDLSSEVVSNNNSVLNIYSRELEDVSNLVNSHNNPELEELLSGILEELGKIDKDGEVPRKSIIELAWGTLCQAIPTLKSSLDIGELLSKYVA
ncbi:hypothetical protein HBA55_17850 [Pseudomaricurvus alkylphenolicus]|uniref:hypothetical protein n=1 Tax=Pseudomaricurvus alkylphenolicus TaxID=1306991 RepID=UPI00141FB228|nr:hypothetical protein [Pseudomaricurvus alkylphenolicus]NIB41471.1 hypothetical protein [Pseudomaricurvus alkylphenolicus]